MGYVPTGKPPGRPRKEDAPKPSEPQEIAEPATVPSDEQKPLSRAREGFRRAYANPADDLHSPPRFGVRRERHVGKRPMLHPNVIAKA